MHAGLPLLNSFYSVDEWLICAAVDELDDDLAKLIGSRGELRIIGDVFSARRLEYIEVVDAHTFRSSRR